MKIRKLVIALILVFTIVATTGCGSKLYESSKSGFNKVTNVQGVSFEVLSTWSKSATAIFTINEDDTYDGLYVKKADDSYLLFDMQNILIAVCETDFNFKGNENVDTLKQHDINNIWLTTDDKKLEYKAKTKDGVYKIIAEAKADFSVTPTQYATFQGYVSSVRSGDQEYSMFVGAMTTNSSLSKTQEELCSHVAKSFEMTKDNKKKASTESDVVEKDSKQKEQDKKKSKSEKESKQDAAVTPEVKETEEIIKEETITVESEEAEISEKNETIETDPPNTDKKETIEVESDVQPEETETPVEKPKAKKASKKAEKPLKNAFTADSSVSSSTYKPINIGDAGMFYLYDGKNMSIAAVRPDAIYTGDEAERLILTYGGRKTSPSVGTEFVVVEYSATVDPRESYIDCKFLGVDGENLNYLGVAYPSKCYDMYENITTKDGVYSKIYAYYEVPIGTREYLLKFGSNTGEKSLDKAGSDIGSITANYIVDTGYRAMNPREQLKKDK